jgi:hypothetical protein
LPSRSSRLQPVAVVAAAREYYRTDGDVTAHNELMDAVERLEQSYQAMLDRPASCFCGTGHEHERGAGYHCRKPALIRCGCGPEHGPQCTQGL